jgi:hypothetical protein
MSSIPKGRRERSPAPPAALFGGGASDSGHPYIQTTPARPTMKESLRPIVPLADGIVEALLVIVLPLFLRYSQALEAAHIRCATICCCFH